MTEIQRVGPKGYIHGWIFVGAPGVGDHVTHPQHGHGIVTGASGDHVGVRFDSGANHTFPVRQESGAGHFDRAPDLSNLPPAPKAPDRNAVNDFSLKSMSSHLDALKSRDAHIKAARAAQLQKSGGSHQEIMQHLAGAEMTAPEHERAFHAARLDAYAKAYGLKGFYRHKSSRGDHMVQVNKIRTPAEGDRGRYYASDPFNSGRPQIIDRDTGKIVEQSASSAAAKARISELEAPRAPKARRAQTWASRWTAEWVRS